MTLDEKVLVNREYTKTLINALNKKQYDWEENNLDSPNYIKNRTHYAKEQYGEIISVVVPGDNTHAERKIKYEFVKGKTYEIVINKHSYFGKAWTPLGNYEGSLSIGNADIFGLTGSPETDLPFYIYIEPFTNNSIKYVYMEIYIIEDLLPPSEVNDIYDISIQGNYEDIYHLDKKYLPNINEITNLFDAPYNSKGLRGIEANLDVYPGHASVALGYNTYANGDFSFAMGKTAKAYGESSVALGHDTLANGDYSFAEGFDTNALGMYSHSEGKGDRGVQTENQQFPPILISGDAGSVKYLLHFTNSAESHPSAAEPGLYIQYGSDFYYIEQIIIENNTRYMILNRTLDENNAIKYGYIEVITPGVAIGEASHSEGFKTIAHGRNSHAEGKITKAHGDNSHAEGSQTFALGSSSHAEGSGTNIKSFEMILSGDANSTQYSGKILAEYASIFPNTQNKIVVIYQNEPYYITNYRFTNGGPYSTEYELDITLNKSLSNTDLINESVMAYGYGIAFNEETHTEGNNCNAVNNGSHAEGISTLAFGEASHTEGYITVAEGKQAHAEGNNTQALGDYSHSEGNKTKASGNYSHAEGQNTIASGEWSHVEGVANKAIGSSSHVEGQENIAEGIAAHAEGANTQAIGIASHAEGSGTIALGARSHVEGKNNLIDENDEYIHIAGNGKSRRVMPDGSYSPVGRSNAHTLDWDGNAWFAGDVYVGSTSGTNRDEGSKKLATIEDLSSASDVSLEDAKKYTNEKIDALNVQSIDGLETALTNAETNALTDAKAYTDEKVAEINTALNGKEAAGAAAQALTDAKAYTDQELANLVGSAPETLDTIEELATAFQENEDIIETLNQAIGNKADKTELDKKPGLKYSNKEINYQYYDGTQWVTIKGYASPNNPEIFNDYTNNIASGDYSHAEGQDTLAHGEASHAEGARTQASGARAHAEGEETKAVGDNSHTEGVYSVAIGHGSHAEGLATMAKGNFSHAEGFDTIASGLYQHVQGKYNIKDTESKYAHIVGNGESYAAPSNAHTLDWQGNAWFAGNITLGPDNKEVATKADLESINSNIQTVSYENTVFATQEGQTVFNIGIGSFDATTDKLDVHDGRLYLTRNLDYTVSGQTVTLTEGVGNGDSITFTVLKNVPVLEEEITISPSLLENGSIPLSKLQSMPTAADVGTYTKAEVDAIVANAVAAVKAEIMASLTVTSDVPMTFGITDDGGLSVTYDDQAVNA